MPTRDVRGVGDTVRVEYVSRVPRPPLDGLIDDLYYLDGASPYDRLTLPPAPSALLIVNLGAPFRVRGGTDVATDDYADGCVVTMPTRAWEFGYPRRTRSVGVHFKPWGLAPFVPMPAAELCDRPVTIEQAWGRPATAELRDRLAAADRPHEMLTVLETELMRRLRETAGLGLVRHTSSVITATSGAVAIGDLSAAAGVSSTHLARRFKALIGVTPKRLARTYRFTAAMFSIDPAEPIDWAALASSAGYFDQAHFGHEFRAFTGLTPTRYLEVRRRFLREHPGHVLEGWPLPAD
jgi:AraC-like DNA-binding protein